jgi:hypothetical protein
MKSLAVRVLLVVLALAAQGAAGYKVWSLDRATSADRAAVSAIDQQIRQLVAGISELGGAQQAYVAAGQDADFWIRKAGGLLQSLPGALTTLRQSIGTPETSGALESVTEQLTALARLDERARDLVKSGQQLSASDLVFTDGAQIVARSTALLNDARTRELTRRDSAEATRKWTAVYFAGGAVGVTAIMLLALVAIPRPGPAQQDEDVVAGDTRGLGLSGVPRPADRVAEVEAAPAASPAKLAEEARPVARPVLGDAARICISLTTVKEMAELPPLLEQTARVLDAAGVIVWIADRPGGELHAAIAHGYSAQILARMGAVAASADNATATAFRTGTIQSVPGDGDVNGALAVPLTTSVGIAGVMAAEVRHGRESDQVTRDLAAIIAAQLATLFTPAAAAEDHP